MKQYSFILTAELILLLSCNSDVLCAMINRKALVERNQPIIHSMDSLSSLSVGNGNFAFTVDPTGLQTFPTFYANGVPLGTESSWSWHSFTNTEHYTFSETLRNYNFRGWNQPYAVQFKTKGRQQDAANWFRINPHRLHLGIVGLEITNPQGKQGMLNDIHHISQKLDL